MEVLQISLDPSTITLFIECRSTLNHDSSSTQSMYTKRIHIKNHKYKNSDSLATAFTKKFPQIFNTDQIPFTTLKQISERVLQCSENHTSTTEKFNIGRQQVRLAEPKKAVPTAQNIRNMNDSIDDDLLNDILEDSSIIDNTLIKASTKNIEVDHTSKYEEPINANHTSNFFHKFREPSAEDLLKGAVDLNKCSDELNRKAKELMEMEFSSKRLKPGDPGYVYDKQVDFDPPEEENEWDED